MYRRYFDDEEKFFRSMMFAEETAPYTRQPNGTEASAGFVHPMWCVLKNIRRSPRAQSSLRNPHVAVRERSSGSF